MSAALEALKASMDKVCARLPARHTYAVPFADEFSLARSQCRQAAIKRKVLERQLTAYEQQLVDVKTSTTVRRARRRKGAGGSCDRLSHAGRLSPRRKSCRSS